jgi:hypothetical protein
MKARKRVIDVKTKKKSSSYDDWIKYEITIENEDGTTDTVPAYGRDLQDALSRVNHDIRVTEMYSTFKNVPQILAVFIWFLYFGGFSLWAYMSDTWHVLLIGIGILLSVGTYFYFWSKKKNIIEIEEK